MREHFATTRDAAVGLARAHVDLAKAEATAIGGQVARVAALIGVAVGLAIAGAILFVVGSALFLGEWLLGSLGWGVVHGLLLFVAIGLTCIVAAVGVSARRIGQAIGVAVIAGLIVGVVLALDLPNRAYVAIGDAAASGIEPGVRPLVVGLVVGAIIGLVLAIAGAARTRASVGGAAIGGAVAGLIVGGLSAITFGPQAGAGVGLAVAELTWMGLLGIDVARHGVDVETLKARFYPTQTIETSKETLEWLQKRMPPGIG